MKVLAPQAIVAPFAAFALLRTALNMFVAKRKDLSTSQNSQNLHALKKFSENSFDSSKNNIESRANSSTQHSPTRLAILIVLLSVIRAIFALSGGRWFYKHIVRGVLSSASFVGSMKFLSGGGSGSMASSFLNINNRNLQLLARGMGTVFVTLSGILLHLSIGKAKQELFNHIESASKKHIVSELLNEHSFTNPYGKKLDSQTTAAMLNDTISQFGKACVLTIESSGFLCGTMMASSAMTTSIFSDLIPSLADWNSVGGFMEKFDRETNKRCGLELVKLFGFMQFVNVVPISIKYFGIKPSKQNMDMRGTISAAKPVVEQSQQERSNSHNNTNNNNNANDVNTSTSNKIGRWLPLLAEALRQSPLLSSNICVTDKERDAFAQHLLKIAHLTDSNSSTIRLRQQLEENQRRLTSSSAKKRSAASAAIESIKEQLEQQKVSILDMFKPNFSGSSSSSFSGMIQHLFKNPASFAILVANIFIGLDAGFISDSSTRVFTPALDRVVDSDDVVFVNGGNWDKHSTAMLQWVSMIQSSLSIFACASDLGKASSRLAPLLVRSSRNSNEEENNNQSSQNKTKSPNSSAVNPKSILNSEIIATESAPTQVGYVSLHRQEAKLVGKVTVVESQLFTGADASASASLENSLSGPEGGAAVALAMSNSHNNILLNEQQHQPIPTLSNSCSLPFHLYPGAGLLVATETSKIGEMFIATTVSSIQNSFSTSSSSNNNISSSFSSSIVEVVPADPLIVPCLSLADQITFPKRARDVDLSLNDVAGLLTSVGLQHLIDDDPDNINVPVCSSAANDSIKKNCEISLNQTQRQQVAIARILYRKPRYVILWNCLFTTNHNHNNNSGISTSSMSLFKLVTDSLKKSGVTVVSVFTCANILDWSIRRGVMSCHFNGLFLRDDNVFLKNAAFNSASKTSKNNNNNSNKSPVMKRSSSTASMDSSSTVPLGFGGDYCSAAFGILANPPPLHMLNMQNYPSIVDLDNTNDGSDDSGDSSSHGNGKKEEQASDSQEIPSFSPEPFLSFSRILSRSTVAVI